MLRDIIKEKRPNDFELSKKQENALINAFITGNSIFDEDTPSFILLNHDCINIAIERDPSSADFVRDFTPELEEKTLQLALKNKYILNRNSPVFLRNNYAIALNSIRENPSSADYVNWNSMTEEDEADLIEETIKAGYVLSSSSCQILKDNPDIVLSSISKDINTLTYSSSTAKSHPKIFKYLIQNGHTFTTRELKEQSLYTFCESDTMRYAIEKMGILDKNDSEFTDIFEEYPNDIDKYIERYIELFVKAFNTLPTIQNLKTVLQACAEFEWDNYREEHLDDYANIFGKICSELKNNNDYSDAIEELEFLEKMKIALDDKYYLLLQAMEQYYSIIHSNIQLGNIDFARDQIAKLSALYVSISKENFKKEKIEEYFEDIKNYFIPKKTHPIIYKKLIEHKHKDKFKELYQNKDNEICIFLENIVKQYSESFDNDTIWSMINNFLNNGYSKMDSFIKAPRGWNNYKRYEEASKLINRLNSHYIKYTDQELVRYVDIIKYSFETDKYYYEGPSFNNESISRYTEYRKKLQVFEKIKQQIIFKAKKLEINSEILDNELTDISGDLPFTDEYFEFVGLNDCEFYLEDFVDSCVFYDDWIEPSSLIDDEAYEILTNYVLNNGLVWMLLLINKYRNDSLDEIGIDKESILASFDYMKDVSRLSKIFKYDINKFEEVLALCELSECADDKTIAILGVDVIFKLCKYQGYTTEDAEEIVRMAKELVCKMTKRNKSTVPYVNGRTNNYIYSMYNPQDETILLAGINTNACFKIDGNDNDFLHYCALDKNGFVIKITDNFGNFIARASGFRNGNGVYINQLRTIYDEGGDGYEGSYEKEKAEIIETFYKACNDIVETSQQNKNEQDKIDFVFVTQSYALSRIESNVDRNVTNKIGDDPMDTTSEDWKNFVNNTENLQEIDDEDDTFSTDYGNYDLICVASSKKHRIFGKLTAKDIRPKDVEAVYVSPRSKITATENPDLTIINKINKINGINSYLNDIDFESIEIPKGTTIFIGDNWYIAYNNGVIIQSCVLDFDKKAVIEFEVTKKAIQEFNINNNQQLNIEQVSQQLEIQSSEGHARVLRINH